MCKLGKEMNARPAPPYRTGRNITNLNMSGSNADIFILFFIKNKLSS